MPPSLCARGSRQYPPPLHSLRLVSAAPPGASRTSSLRRATYRKKSLACREWTLLRRASPAREAHLDRAAPGRACDNSTPLPRYLHIPKQQHKSTILTTIGKSIKRQQIVAV